MPTAPKASAPLMLLLSLAGGAALLGCLTLADPVRGEPRAKTYPGPLDLEPKPIAADRSVKYDYPIVYVRAPRRGDDKAIQWADVNNPLAVEPGSDLMLLKPDGKQEVLV